MTTDHHEQILDRLDRILELLEDIRDARQAHTGHSLAQRADYLIQQHKKGLMSETAFRNRMTEMTDIRFHEGFATGGIVEAPEGQPLIGWDGCHVPGYCPTHDGRVIAIRDGKPVDVTEEAIRARLPNNGGNQHKHENK